MFRATLLAALVCATVRADAPKTDLTGLKDAVRAADKRGANVEPVKLALAALEQALAKGATVAAPPELAALRDAVESALKKGESIEAVSDALGAVERALTGKAFERPKGVAQALPTIPTFPKGAGRPPKDGGALGARTVRSGPLPGFRGAPGAIDGVVITSVLVGSPADKAGLQARDVIVEFAGMPVRDSFDLNRRVRARGGEKVELVVVRAGERLTIKDVALLNPFDR